MIHQTNYNILDFVGLPDSYPKLCIGVVGYIFLQRESKYGSYIPANFLRSLSLHCEVDIIEFLIFNEYLIKLESNNSNTGFYTITGLVKPEKKDANIYRPLQKLRKLSIVMLFDDKLTTYIDKHLHLLNNQNFNHYDHSYKHISFNIPYEVSVNTKLDDIRVLREWGHPEYKEYNHNLDFDQNKYDGRHYNIFTINDKNKELIKYSSLINPIEIGFANSIPTILADQLLKTQGDNDYSTYFKINKFKIPKLVKERKYSEKQVNLERYVPTMKELSEIIPTVSVPLFTIDDEYDISREILLPHLYNATFGWIYIEQFKKKFPQAFNVLHKIKSGGDKKGPPFCGFAKDISPKIIKKDFRLSLKEKHPAFKEGQSYYKIISLVCHIREVKIMRDIWRRLKKCDIIFIPLHSSVVVSTNNEIAAIQIFQDILKEHISKRIYTKVFKSTFGDVK